MAFKVDFRDGKAVKWSKKDGKTVREEDPDYRPKFYIDGSKTDLIKARSWIAGHEGVQATSFEEWKTGLGRHKEKVLRVDVLPGVKTTTIASNLSRKQGRPKFRFYNVDFSPQFQYFLQRREKPVPEDELEKMDIGIPRTSSANGKFKGLSIDGEKIEGSEKEILETFRKRLKDQDPDIVLVDRAQTVRLLHKKTDFRLGRENGFEQVAGDNTVSSYGKVVHSSSRFNIPGRILVNRSNSFMLSETTMKGLWDLVERSYRPLQELAWASIGRILTSIEIRKAYHEREVLTSWKNWDPEKPKTARTLHKADTGGFIFNPEPEVFHDVKEADFSSLYPNIMVKKNISPETVNCDCCSNSEVPELDYTICENRRGFISEVLEPIVKDRKRMKEELKKNPDPERKEYLQGSVDALKWILVSCFGYMGHAHASYGAIECHQAIQAYDRDIMLKTKEMFEKRGFRVIHGIIDSIWVQNREEEHDYAGVCDEVSQEIGIELEEEYEFDWIAFTPRKSTDADIATLNRYFGRKKDGGFKKAGIQTEQSSTCDFVKEAQSDMIEAMGKKPDPEKAFEVLKRRINQLEKDMVDSEELVIEKKVSKPLEEYKVSNRSTAAMKRYRKHGIEIKPGQEVNYVVKNDEKKGPERVRLEFEEKRYDQSFYRERLVDAAYTVLSPFGYSEEEVEAKSSGEERLTISSFT